MTSTSQDDGAVADAGPSTDQHVTGEPETGTFQTDRAPTADTPVHGSSNSGLNGPESDEEPPGARTTYE